MHARRELLDPRLLAPRRVDLHGGHLDPAQVHGRVVRQHVHRLEREVEPERRGVEREHVQRLVRRREEELPARAAVGRVETRDGERAPDVREPGRLPEDRPAVYGGRERGQSVTQYCTKCMRMIVAEREEEVGGRGGEGARTHFG